MKNFFNLKALAIASVLSFVIVSSFLTTSCSTKTEDVKTSKVVDFEVFLSQGYTWYSVALANGDTIVSRVYENYKLAFISNNCEISYKIGSRRSEIISLKKAPE